jgi:Ca2+/Na+ antiporter
MPIFLSAPIALFGFFIAASWIDSVDLLSHVGTLLDILRMIKGVTVLELGNSMSDLSADVALASKGLASM